MFITKKTLPRRTFLRGMGTALALPLLDAMVPALSAVAQTAAAPVKRFGAIYVPNGLNVSQWTPKGSGTSFEFSPTLTPFTPFRDRITVLTNLDSDPGESWGRGNGDHARCQPAWLSATHPKKAETVVRAGTTIDQMIANEVGAETPLRSLEVAIQRTDLSTSGVGGYGAIYGHTISWRNPNTPLPVDNNPRTVFERMFGEGSTGAKRLAQLRRNRSILDSIPQEISSLQKNLGPSDKRQVDEYLYSIREVERRIQMAEVQNSKSDLEVPERPSGAPPTFGEHVKLMFDLQVLAFQADITRVATFLMAQEFSLQTYPEIGVPDGHHSISHHQLDPEKLAKVAKVDTYHVALVAYYLDKLRSTRDGEGNLLDHSMILYGSGFSDGNTHAHVNLPVVVAGGGAGTIKGGRHLVYPKGTPMANLLVSLTNKMGVPIEQIGDSSGPLEDFSEAYLSSL
jgi:hypothetical protein